MIERSYSLNMSGVKSIDLRIALDEMKKDVKRLQEELDAEREATATSASEAMSMILKIQREKAALAMEASQYKRMVEEKMSHVEMSLELLEDLNYCKEVEIKNLECELHAYRCNLMDNMRSCDRSQTPSPEPIDIDLLVPIGKEVIEQSTRDQEKVKKLDKQLKELKDSVKDQFKTLKHETISSNFKDVVAKEKAKGLCKYDFLVKKMSKKSSKHKRDRSVKKDHARGSCSANDGDIQTELQRLKERVKQLEQERCKKEPQKMILQRKSEEKLGSVQSEMKISQINQKLLHSNDSAIVAVQEAMLYFWL